ncbi:MAG TPA: hypothetical protein VN038_28520 [Dyadobacter sp.]|nr:hypothetical protein [Dyadobacter sp.]
MEALIRRIKEIAAENELGFTITLPNCEFVTSGYVVAMLDTQNSFGDEGLRRVIEMHRILPELWAAGMTRGYFTGMLSTLFMIANGRLN